MPCASASSVRRWRPCYAWKNVHALHWVGQSRGAARGVVVGAFVWSSRQVSGHEAVRRVSGIVLLSGSLSPAACDTCVSIACKISSASGALPCSNRPVWVWSPRWFCCRALTELMETCCPVVFQFTMSVCFVHGRGHTCCSLATAVLGWACAESGLVACVCWCAAEERAVSIVKQQTSIVLYICLVLV